MFSFFKKIKEKNPEDLFQKANSLMQIGKGKEAISLYEKAAQLGHTFARTNLAISYYFGDHGLSIDYKKAWDLFNISSDEGDISAKFYLGMMAKDGHAGGKNPQFILKMLNHAAMNGMAEAQYELGRFYIEGEKIGLKRDFRRAIHWLAYAAEQGHPDANLKFNQLYYNGAETKEEATGFWFERQAANKGQKIPCSVPYSVTISDSEYIVQGFKC